MIEIDPIYRELAAKLGKKDSKYLPRILEKLANLEQAEIVRQLPASQEEIAAVLGLTRETVEGHIAELIEKGLVVPTRKGPRMTRSLQQLHDASASNTKFDKSLGDEYFDLWWACRNEEMAEDMVKESVGKGYPRWRCIPRWKAIKDVPGVLPFDDVREALRGQETIALVRCPCKRVHRQRECGVPDETCINVGRAAQYNIDRGVGKKLTFEEALRAIEHIDNYPVIHLTVNQRTVNQLICNCHWCCCSVLHPLFSQDKYKIEEGFAKSRFEAVVQPDECTACQTCVERCQFGAIQMKYYPQLHDERSFTDTEKCMGCGCCVISCPNEARTMKLVRPPEHVPEALEGAW